MNPRQEHIQQQARTKRLRYKEKRKLLGLAVNKGDTTAQIRRWKSRHVRWKKKSAEVWLNNASQLPSWADETAIVLVYKLAKKLRQETGENWVVDHVVPLRGVEVMGLHHHLNLQIILGADNLAKGNTLH